jgi:hypothetical protein
VDDQLSELEERGVGLALSDPISQRLDVLIERAEATGERTNRKELIAALILGASPDGDALSSLLRRYRTARVRDTLLEHDESVSTVVFRQRRPGPRRRRRSDS